VKVHPFILGDIGGALIAGAIAGAFFDKVAVMVFAAILAGNALIGVPICWWRPGFKAAAWKLWLMATLANPLMIAGVVWSLIQYDCLVGEKSGWNCMFSDVGPFAAGMSLLPPFLGMAVLLASRRLKGT
jgi:hypothetical protein